MYLHPFNSFLKKNFLPKEVGVSELATQKPINRPGWWKGKFTLFQMPATGGEWQDGGEGWQASVQSPTLFL